MSTARIALHAPRHPGAQTLTRQPLGRCLVDSGKITNA